MAAASAVTSRDKDIDRDSGQALAGSRRSHRESLRFRDFTELPLRKRDFFLLTKKQSAKATILASE